MRSRIGTARGRVRARTKLGRNARRSSDDSKFLLGRPSSVSRALQVIGDKWSFMVVREAFFGVRRYDQIQANLNIAPNILTDRLSRFVAKGIFRKRLYQSSPPRYEYLLTDMGRDLYGPFITMMAWGDRWLSGGKAPRILTHQTCGKDFDPVVICDRCRKPIDASVMQYKLSYNPQGTAAGARATCDRHRWRLTTLAHLNFRRCGSLNDVEKPASWSFAKSQITLWWVGVRSSRKECTGLGQTLPTEVTVRFGDAQWPESRPSAYGGHQAADIRVPALLQRDHLLPGMLSPGPPVARPA